MPAGSELPPPQKSDVTQGHVVWGGEDEIDGTRERGQVRGGRDLGGRGGRVSGREEDRMQNQRRLGRRGREEFVGLYDDGGDGGELSGEGSHGSVREVESYQFGEGLGEVGTRGVNTEMENRNPRDVRRSRVNEGGEGGTSSHSPSPLRLSVPNSQPFQRPHQEGEGEETGEGEEKEEQEEGEVGEGLKAPLKRPSLVLNTSTPALPSVGEPPVKKRKFSPIRWDKEREKSSRTNIKIRHGTNPSPPPPPPLPNAVSQTSVKPKVGGVSLSSRKTVNTTLTSESGKAQPSSSSSSLGNPSPSRPTPPPPPPPPFPPPQTTTTSFQVTKVSSQTEIIGGTNQRTSYTKSFQFEKISTAENLVVEKMTSEVSSTVNGVENLESYVAMEVDQSMSSGSFQIGRENSVEDEVPKEILATIGASRWAETIGTPDSEKSPNGNVLPFVSRNGVNTGRGFATRVRNPESEEGTPEPGEYVPGNSVDGGGTEEKNMGVVGEVGRGVGGGRDDEEYEMELNRRELADLEESEADEDMEEQRPETESEEEEEVKPSEGNFGGRNNRGNRLIDMLQGCRSVDDFERLNRIDEGTYGVVYRARDKKTGEVVALKKVKMDKEREGFPLTSLREINILLSFHHSAIVDVKEVVVGSNLDSIFMVMEYMEHDVKSLMESMKQPFSQSEVKCLMIQLLEGTKYLHENWVLHRDLKTSNLLLNNQGELKICDFGLSRQYGSPLKAYTHLVVTLWYRAPELLLGAKLYSTAIDMWSLGCIMAELLSKEALFSGKTEIDQVDKIFKLLGTPNERIWPEFATFPSIKKVNFVRQPYNRLREKFPAAAFGGRPALSEAGFDLLNKLLTYDPKKRITAEAALHHEWFREVPLPKAQELMPTFPARNEQDRRLRRLHRSPDPLEEVKRRPPDVGAGGLFG